MEEDGFDLHTFFDGRAGAISLQLIRRSSYHGMNVFLSALGEGMRNTVLRGPVIPPCIHNELHPGGLLKFWPLLPVLLATGIFLSCSGIQEGERDGAAGGGFLTPGDLESAPPENESDVPEVEVPGPAGKEEAAIPAESPGGSPPASRQEPGQEPGVSPDISPDISQEQLPVLSAVEEPPVPENPGEQPAPEPGQESPPAAGEGPPPDSEKKPSPDAGEESPSPLDASGELRDMVSKDYGDDCMRSGCHAQLGKSPWVHGPISVVACDPCHLPQGDPGNHEFRLAKSKEALCVTCHVVEVVRDVVHEPYAKSECLECHNPHGGKDRKLLVMDEPAQLCAKCHEPEKSGEEETSLHEPFSLGECTVCHAAHQSNHDHLLQLPNEELCVSCHTEVGKLLAGAAYVHGPAAVDCTACHSSHRAGHPYLLRQDIKPLCLGCHDNIAEKLAVDTFVHEASSEGEECLSCHTPHASQFNMQLKAVPMDLCLGCHNREIVKKGTGEIVANVASQIRSSKYKHGPVETGDCQSCHFTHSSSYAKLLHESYPAGLYKEFDVTNYEQCFRCHEPSLVLMERTFSLTNFRDGDRNLHFLHVNRKKGRTCRICHEVHASNFPRLIRKDVLFGTIQWPLPIGFKKTETGGTCSPGCHKMKLYNNMSTVPAGKPGENPEE